MKKIICTVFTVMGLIVAAYAPIPATASCDCGTVTSAARATFTQAATLGSVSLKSLELGTGVFIEPDGSASGVYSAVLTGKSLLGQAKQITIDGRVLRGEIAPDGRVYFNGIASVNSGDGLPAVSGVPFSVSTTGNSVRLTLGSISLPAAQVDSGNISVE